VSIVRLSWRARVPCRYTPHVAILLRAIYYTLWRGEKKKITTVVIIFVTRTTCRLVVAVAIAIETSPRHGVGSNGSLIIYYRAADSAWRSPSQSILRHERLRRLRRLAYIYIYTYNGKWIIREKCTAARLPLYRVSPTLRMRAKKKENTNTIIDTEFFSGTIFRRTHVLEFRAQWKTRTYLRMCRVGLTSRRRPFLRDRPENRRNCPDLCCVYLL